LPSLQPEPHSTAIVISPATTQAQQLAGTTRRLKERVERFAVSWRSRIDDPALPVAGTHGRSHL
jgi:hypothetical protein